MIFLSYEKEVDVKNSAYVRNASGRAKWIFFYFIQVLDAFQIAEQKNTEELITLEGFSVPDAQSM